MANTFTLNNGNTYEVTKGGYCYATIDGKKTRCSFANFQMAHTQFIKEEEGRKKDRQTEENFNGKKAEPKAKRTRKSKDIAYEGHGVTLTAKQVDFIHHLSDTCYWEDGLHSRIWCDCLADEIRGQFTGKPMTTGAMLSTICEKGLGERTKDRINNRNCTSFCLTDLGKKVAADLGLR